MYQEHISVPDNCAVDIATDPYGLELLCLKPDLSEIDIKKTVTVILCRKPGKQEFVRARSGDEWRIDALIVEDPEKQDYYLVVGRELQDYVLHDLRDGIRVTLRAAVTRAGEAFLWLLKLSAPKSRANTWNTSALAAAERAETNWVRVTSNSDTSRYEVSVASGINIDPKWSELTFKQMLEISFKDRFIDSQDHPLLRQLRGEV